MAGFRRALMVFLFAALFVAPAGADVRDVRLGVKGAT
jgi:hypothetical protein